MKLILKIEEFGYFIAGLVLYYELDFELIWLPALIFLPDISMIGYLINNKFGAYVYNFVHNKFLALIIILIGLMLDNSTPFLLTGLILFIHSSLDRILGYGLKKTSGFKDTHLGKI